MIEERAKVVEVTDDAVVIEVQRQSVCGQCAANKGCGTAVLQKVLGNKRTRVSAISEIPVAVHDDVVVGLAETAMLKGSFAVYMVPLVLMFIFGVLGETLATQLSLTSSNATSLAFALMGLIGGGLWLRRFNRSIINDRQYQPVILRQANSHSVALVDVVVQSPT